MALETVAQLERMLQETDGVAVVYGGVTTYGHLGAVDESLLPEAEVYGARLGVTVATGALAGLAQRGAITVHGTAYTIRGHARIGDGALTLILLKEA